MQKKKPPSLHDKPNKIYPAKTKAKNVLISLPRYHSACRHAAVDLSLATRPFLTKPIRRLPYVTVRFRLGLLGTITTISVPFP